MYLSKIILPTVLLLLAALGIWYFFLQPSGKEQQDSLRMSLKRGPFKMEVTATGELAAKRSVKIRAPQGMRAAGIYETTLSDIITEGTIVEKGEYVASLDRTELAGKMSEVQTEIEKVQTQLEQAKIDTAIELRGIRDELANLRFAKQEKQLSLEQSQYEPRSVIQQAELDLQRTERDYQQLLKKYELKKQQAIAQIQEIDALLRQNRRQLKVYSDLSTQFRINAPESGMVIYARTWRGKKEPGSRISAWNPVVAELPDLSDMISQTYVNEVDISRVQEGQDVNIRVDAFPDRSYTGKVIKVANIGEQLKGYDAKVFEVIVQVNESDTILRPAMTTSNEIITGLYDSLLAIPLESLVSDSLTYVYKEGANGLLRQEVITGLSNNNEIVVEHGLKEGDIIYLVPPEGASAAPLQPIDPEVREKVRQRLEREAEQRKAEARKQEESIEGITPPSGRSSGDGGSFIIVD
jgi:hypothetical protein